MALIGGTRQNLSGLDSAGSTDVRSHFALIEVDRALAAGRQFQGKYAFLAGRSVQLTFFTAGGIHVPSPAGRIEGGVVFGQ